MGEKDIGAPKIRKNFDSIKSLSFLTLQIFLLLFAINFKSDIYCDKEMKIFRAIQKSSHKPSTKPIQK